MRIFGKTQHQIGVIVGGDIKNHLIELSLQNGSTISREAEHLILKGLALHSNPKIAEGARRQLSKVGE